jgi:hypothetical protein
LFADSGAIALASVATCLARSGKALSTLVKPSHKYIQSGEINFENEDKEAALEDLKGAFPDAKIEELDGVTVDGIDIDLTDPVVKYTGNAGSYTVDEDDFDAPMTPDGTELTGALIRAGARKTIQELLEAEVTEVLGRDWYERREPEALADHGDLVDEGDVDVPEDVLEELRELRRVGRGDLDDVVVDPPEEPRRPPRAGRFSTPSRRPCYAHRARFSILGQKLGSRHEADRAAHPVARRRAGARPPPVRGPG